MIKDLMNVDASKMKKSKRIREQYSKKNPMWSLPVIYVTNSMNLNINSSIAQMILTMPQIYSGGITTTPENKNSAYHKHCRSNLWDVQNVEGLVQQNLIFRDTPRSAAKTNVQNVEGISKQIILFKNTLRVANRKKLKRKLADQNLNLSQDQNKYPPSLNDQK